MISEAQVRRVEQAAIEAAAEYAAANGYSRDDKVAIGLVLAGMAIGARCSEAVRIALVAGYQRALPETAVSLNGWADFLEGSLR